MSFFPEFVEKTESEWDPLPHFLFVRSLEDFVAVLREDRLGCPVPAIRFYLDLTVSPAYPTRELSTNTLSFFLRRSSLILCLSAGASP